MSGESDLASYMEAAAVALWGEPNKVLSKGDDLRWGSQGSRSIDVVKGTFFDHEADEGGGVLKLLKREKGLEGRAAFEWLRDNCGMVIAGGGNSAARPAPAERKPPSNEGAKVSTSGKAKQKREIVATYDYTDADGKLIYQVVRFEPKNFAQRRPSGLGDGSWLWGLDDGEFMRKGPGSDWMKFDQKRFDEWRFSERRKFDGAVEHGLYRLPDVLEALKAGEPVAIAEGEKDADNLWGLGLAATTNSGGAKHWSKQHAELFRGADVVIPIDNDNAGRERGGEVAGSLHGVARKVRVLDLAKHWPEIGEKQDISDWIGQGGTISQLFDLIRETPDWQPSGPATKFGAVPWQQMAATDAPRHRWLVKGLIAENEITMLAGGTQSGKTFGALDLSMSVARGIPWFGRKVAGGGVIYQAGEDPTGVRTLRIPAYVKEHGLSFGTNMDFVLLTGLLNLWRDEAQTGEFIAECKALAARMTQPLKLIVIDTYAKATIGAEEINAKEMGIVMDRAERIRRETGAAVLLVDHLNADGGRVRGTANKTANIDSVLICRFATTSGAPGARKGDSEILEDANNRRVREITNDIKFGGKNKNGSYLKEPLRFVLRAVPIGIDEDGENILSCVVDVPSGDDALKPASQPFKRLNVKYSMALTALKQATEKRGRQAPASVPNDAYPPTDRHGNRTDICVTLADWRDELAPMVSDEGEDAELAKERVRDHLRKTIIPALSSADRGYIRKHGDWVWRTAKRIPGIDYTPRETAETPPEPAPISEDVLKHGF